MNLSGLIASLIRCRIVVEHKIASMLMMGIEKKTVCLEVRREEGWEGGLKHVLAMSFAISPIDQSEIVACLRGWDKGWFRVSCTDYVRVFNGGVIFGGHDDE